MGITRTGDGYVTISVDGGERFSGDAPLLTVKDSIIVIGQVITLLLTLLKL